MLAAVRMSGSEILAAAGIAAAGIVGLALAWWIFRRWWRKQYSEPESPSAAWTLQQLRELKIQGQITDAEFARLKSALLGELKGEDGASSSTSG